jgi:hypothetical protein
MDTAQNRLLQPAVVRKKGKKLKIYKLETKLAENNSTWMVEDSPSLHLPAPVTPV